MTRADSIFISVVSYCDPMLGFTLASARSQASDPTRIHIGVVDQSPAGGWIKPQDEWSREHLRIIRINALEARGPCWARNLAMSLYQGEDWYFQVDSHTWFEPGWDERLLDWGHRLANQGHARNLVTCYPNPFVLQQGCPVARPVTGRVLAHVVKGDSFFSDDNPVLMFEGVGVETDDPVPGFHVAGGCLFGPGTLVGELPYDPFLYFHGEEQSFALRAWTRGWNIWHVPAVPIYHLYTDPGTQPRPMHWSPDIDQQRATRSAALEKSAMHRLSTLIRNDNSLGIYGLGDERTLAEYAGFSGIDYSSRTIDPSARKSRHGYT